MQTNLVKAFGKLHGSEAGVVLGLQVALDLTSGGTGH